MEALLKGSDTVLLLELAMLLRISAQSCHPFRLKVASRFG